MQRTIAIPVYGALNASVNTFEEYIGPGGTRSELKDMQNVLHGNSA